MIFSPPLHLSTDITDKKQKRMRLLVAGEKIIRVFPPYV